MPDLRKIASNCFRKERSGHTRQPTAVINEAFLRLARAKEYRLARLLMTPERRLLAAK